MNSQQLLVFPPPEVTPRSEPPYRAAYMHLGLPEPSGKPPLRCVKVYPGVQTGTELLTDDERAMWEYVLHLEAQVRELREPVITVRELSADEQQELQKLLDEKCGKGHVVVLPNSQSVTQVLPPIPAAEDAPPGEPEASDRSEKRRQFFRENAIPGPTIPMPAPVAVGGGQNPPRAKRGKK